LLIATFFSAGGAVLETGLGGSFFFPSLEESSEESELFFSAFLSSGILDSTFFSGCFGGALSESELEIESLSFLSFAFLSLDAALGSIFLA